MTFGQNETWWFIHTAFPYGEENRGVWKRRVLHSECTVDVSQTTHGDRVNRTHKHLTSAHCGRVPTYTRQQETGHINTFVGPQWTCPNSHAQHTQSAVRCGRVVSQTTHPSHHISNKHHHQFVMGVSQTTHSTYSISSTMWTCPKPHTLVTI